MKTYNLNYIPCSTYSSYFKQTWSKIHIYHILHASLTWLWFCTMIRLAFQVNCTHLVGTRLTIKGTRFYMTKINDNTISKVQNTIFTHSLYKSKAHDYPESITNSLFFYKEAERSFLDLAPIDGYSKEPTLA